MSQGPVTHADAQPASCISFCVFLGTSANEEGGEGGSWEKRRASVRLGSCLRVTVTSCSQGAQRRLGSWSVTTGLHFDCTVVFVSWNQSLLFIHAFLPPFIHSLLCLALGEAPKEEGEPAAGSLFPPHCKGSSLPITGAVTVHRS